MTDPARVTSWLLCDDTVFVQKHCTASLMVRPRGLAGLAWLAWPGWAWKVEDELSGEKRSLLAIILGRYSCLGSSFCAPLENPIQTWMGRRINGDRLRIVFTSHLLLSGIVDGLMIDSIRLL